MKCKHTYKNKDKGSWWSLEGSSSIWAYADF